jgi:hypothetical protein
MSIDGEATSGSTEVITPSRTRTCFTSGEVNVLVFCDYMTSKGWVQPTSMVNRIDYGVDPVSTNR